MNDNEIKKIIKEYSTSLDLKKDIAVILAAGRGERIKSETPKMLHKIWGVSTVLRVLNAVSYGLKSNNIVVVGVKAEEVIKKIGKKKNTIFVFQKQQKGTGHALQVVTNMLKGKNVKENIYVFSGDMGLITVDLIKKIKKKFEKTNCDMLFSTGIIKNSLIENSYGRVIRIPQDGNKGKIIEVKEYKDILNLKNNYYVEYNGKRYNFTKEELLNIKEFNVGIYAFKLEKLLKHIKEISSDNVQKEFYLPDIISIFNSHNLKVETLSTLDNNVVLAFNNKEGLKEMEKIAQSQRYNKLKDIVTFEDKEDFFIADEVIEDILRLDRKNTSLDITIGKGACIYRGVKLAPGVNIGKNSILEGNIKLGRKVIIGEGVFLATFPHQQMEIGEGTKIFQRDIIKGNIKIGKNCEIQSLVNITGSDEFPTMIGNNVLIKGTSYIFGSIVEDEIWIEHSVLINKYVEKIIRKDGSIQPIKHYLPQPQGIDAIRELKKK